MEKGQRTTTTSRCQYPCVVATSIICRRPDITFPALIVERETMKFLLYNDC